MRPLSKPLGAYLTRALPLDEPFDAVAPIPLHWMRHFRRGFNQAELLAAEIARRRSIPLLRAVRRVRATRTQTGLSNAKRRQNVAGAFRARRQCSVQGLRILLVDDVMTTGATGSACAAVLKRAGAKSVTLLTVARVDRRAAPAIEPVASRTARYRTVGAT